jgi:hypothetical protein
MTAFSVWYQKDRVIIAGDTLAYTPDRVETRPMGFIDKIIPLPRFKAVIFSRGMYQIAAQAALGLMLDPRLVTIEDAAEALPSMLHEISEEYAAQQDIEDYTKLGLAEIMLVGWSEAAGRPGLWQYLSFQRYEIQDASGAPHGVLAMPQMSKACVQDENLSIDKRLVETILNVGQHFRETNDPARIGGEINAVEITAAGMSFRTLHRFADYEEMRHASAATLARVVRGDLRVSVADGLVPIDEVIYAETGESIQQPARTTPAAPVGQQSMTRQQRRQAEREAAKGRRAA